MNIMFYVPNVINEGHDWRGLSMTIVKCVNEVIKWEESLLLVTGPNQ